MIEWEKTNTFDISNFGTFVKSTMSSAQSAMSSSASSNSGGGGALGKIILNKAIPLNIKENKGERIWTNNYMNF